MISRFKKWSGVLISTLLFAGAAVAGEMPFPPIENGKVKLVVADSPYLLEQGAVFSAKDTLEIEPGGALNDLFEKAKAMNEKL